MKKNVKHNKAAPFFTLLLTGAALYLYGNARLWFAVICCAALCIGLLAFRRRLGERLSAGSVLLLGYTALYCASCLWGPFGSESLPNAASLLIGTAVYLLLLAFSGKNTIAGLPAVFCAGSSLVALLSLDVSSARLLTPRILTPLLSRLGGPGLESMQYEQGTRIVGVVGGANVLGGLLGIGTLLSLYVFLHTSGRKKRLSAIALMLNSSVFFLAFSMGALCAFAFAAAAYLIFSPRGERGQIFLCMVITAVISLLCSAVMTVGLGRYGSPANFLTLLCPFAFGELLAFAFPAAFAALERLKTKGYLKRLRFIAAGAAAFAILFAILAAALSSPIPLTPWAAERSAYLSPGDYTLCLTSDAPVKLLIASQSREQLLDDSYTCLYDGTALQSAFTVPEGAGIVRFSFSGSGSLYRAVYSGAQNGELRMNSPLIPAFVANRMRGLLFSKNVHERLEMWRDGLKLFSASPVIGCGAGAFEAKAYSVQRHYYETKYVHNQYIQCLVDTGVVGLALFILTLFAVFRQTVRRRASNPALASALTACLVMAAFHGFTEVVWSIHAYVLFLLPLLALCELNFPAPLKALRLQKWAPRIYAAAALGFSAAILMHLFVQAKYQNSPESSLTPERIASMCKMEPFSKEIYQLDYVCNYGSDSAQYDEYLAALRGRRSYEVNMLLLQYVYLPAWDEENIRTATQEAYRDRSCDEEAVDRLYSLLVAHNADKLFREGND